MAETDRDRSTTHLDPLLVHERFGLINGVFAEMEDAGGQYRIGSTNRDTVGQVLQIADTTTGDDRDIDSVYNRARQRQIETIFSAITIHAGQQNFAGTEFLSPPCPVDGIEPRRLASAMGKHLPMVRPHLLGINSNNDALIADFCRCFGDEIRIVDGRRIHADFVGAGIKQTPNIGNATDTSTNGQRNEHLRGTGLDDIEDDVALIARCSNVEKSDLVGPLLIVATGDLDRIASIPKIDKIGALDDPPSGDVKTRNDTFSQPQGVTRAFFPIRER